MASRHPARGARFERTRRQAMMKIKTGLMVMAFAAAVGPAAAATLRITCGSSGIEQDLCRVSAREWASRTGNQVEFISVPNNANETLALYQQLLNNGSDKI